MRRFVQIALMMMAIVLMAMSASAQMPIKFGIKGGITSAKVTGDDTEGLDSRSGIVAGVFASLKLTHGLSLQPELLFVQKGAKGPMTIGTTPVDATIKLDYFELPVLLKYGFGGRGAMSPFLVGGVALSSVKSSKTEASVVGIPLLTGDSDNYNERSTDLGLVVGGGVDLTMGPTRLSIELRFTSGTKQIWEDLDGSPVPADQWSYADDQGHALDMKNSAVSFLAGFMF